MKTEGSVLGAAWLDERRVLLTSSPRDSPFTALSSLDLTSGTKVPITREFTNFVDAVLTGDRRAAVAIREERRTGIWLGTARGEAGTYVVPVTPAGASTPLPDVEGGVVYQASTADGTLTLYRLEAGAPAPIVLAKEPHGGFAISPDGRFVVFSSHKALYRIGRDGSGSVTLVARDAAGPGISPDGKTVFFSRIDAAGLYSVPLGGGPVTEVSKFFAAGAPSVSPDGRRLLFGSGKPGVAILCELPRCPNAVELELKSSQWAPDGQGVAYINDEDHGNLWEQPLDGRPPFRLTQFADGQTLEFAWSHDGKHLALARGRIEDDMVLLKGLR
jgi:hypothetical protein